jgi:hypothetical protein
MTLADCPDPGSAAHKRAVAANQWVRDEFGDLSGELAKAGGARNPEATADLTLVLEGVLPAPRHLATTARPREGKRWPRKILDDAAYPVAPSRSCVRSDLRRAGLLTTSATRQLSGTWPLNGRSASTPGNSASSKQAVADAAPRSMRWRIRWRPSAGTRQLPAAAGFPPATGHAPSPS